MMSLALSPLRMALADTAAALGAALVRRLAGDERHGDTMAALVQGHARLQGLLPWLPPDDDERQRLERLLSLLPALLQPQAATAQIRLLAFVLRLQHRDDAVLPLRQGRRSCGTPALPLLVGVWESLQADRHTPLSVLVAPVLRDLLCALVNAVRQQRGAARIAVVLQRLQAVLTVAAGTGAAAQVARVIRRLSLGTLCPGVVNDDERLALWTTLWQLAQGDCAGSTSAAACIDLDLLQAVRSDLGRYHWQLESYLQQTQAASSGQLPYDILLAHYRLPWVLTAAGQTALADLAHLWHHALLLHWQFRVPLSVPALQLLQQMVGVMEQARWSALTDVQVSQWYWRLLALLPTPVRERSPGTLQLDGVAVPLASIPELLSQSFATLTLATDGWFADAASFANHAGAYLADLCLLEHGAAAVRLHAVETVCSHWLALLQRLQRDDGRQWPTDLLQRSHRHLLDLLDEAAAWQLPSPDLALLAELREWQHGTADMTMAVREPAVPLQGAASLEQRLLQQMDKLAIALDRPLRFHCECAAVSNEADSEECQAVLLPLLREEVLAQLQAQQAHRPRAVALQLSLGREVAGIRAVLTVEGGECGADATALSRLRHRLPATVLQLTVQALPAGRRIGLLIGR